MAADVVDCFLNASLLTNAREAVSTMGGCSSALSVWPSTLPPPWRLGAELPKDLKRRWHVTTQERLFDQLRAIWADDRPRVMVDLGCSAGLGRFRNTSDALHWLHYFNYSGSTVLAVDAFEDAVLDMRHRFNLARYASLSGVEKLAIQAALGTNDGATINLGSLARHGVLCCAGRGCGWTTLELLAPDHSCRITRQRMGRSPSPLPTPPTSYPDLFRRADLTGRYAVKQARESPTDANTSTHHAATISDDKWNRLPYPVKVSSLSSMWRTSLRARHIDLLKIDLDNQWRSVGGLEELLQRRAVSVVVMEVDSSSSSWPERNVRRAMLKHGMLNVSLIDQLVWLAGKCGYESFLKVPCCAKDARKDAWLDATHSTWYLPLTDPRRPTFFAPTGLTMASMGNIHDVMLVESASTGLARALSERGRASCHTDWCCSKHAKQKCTVAGQSVSVLASLGWARRSKG